MKGLGGKYPILPIMFFWLLQERGRERERELSFFLRSSELHQLDFVELRTKVHRIDKGYKCILERKDFVEDPNDEISG